MTPLSLSLLPSDFPLQAVSRDAHESSNPQLLLYPSGDMHFDSFSHESSLLLRHSLSWTFDSLSRDNLCQQAANRMRTRLLGQHAMPGALWDLRSPPEGILVGCCCCHCCSKQGLGLCGLRFVSSRGLLTLGLLRALLPVPDAIAFKLSPGPAGTCCNSLS